MAPSNPNILWAGTGEQNNRQSSSWGDGVYRSIDGGTTWSHVGLEDSRAIGRIVVDPKDPDVAYVAALGNLWAPSEMRGVFKRSTRAAPGRMRCGSNTYTGAVDLVMDPHDSRLLYAAAYARLRQPCCFNGGASSGGIYKSADGGATWQRLTSGLPPGDIGRVGLAIAQQTPGLVYAIVENTTAPGIYRSTDGGENWTRMTGWTTGLLTTARSTSIRRMTSASTRSLVGFARVKTPVRHGARCRLSRRMTLASKAITTRCGSTRRTPATSTSLVTEVCSRAGTEAKPTAGSTIYRSGNSMVSVSTMTRRITSMAACKTITRGSDPQCDATLPRYRG